MAVARYNVPIIQRQRFSLHVFWQVCNEVVASSRRSQPRKLAAAGSNITLSARMRAYPEDETPSMFSPISCHSPYPWFEETPTSLLVGESGCKLPPTPDGHLVERATLHFSTVSETEIQRGQFRPRRVPTGTASLARPIRNLIVLVATNLTYEQADCRFNRFGLIAYQPEGVSLGR